MVGYSESSKAYRLYDPDKNEILIRRDVIFDESCIISSKSSSSIPMSPSTLGDPTIEDKFDDMTNEECSKSCEEGIVVAGTQDKNNDSIIKTRSIQDIYQEGPRNYANYALMTRVMNVDDPHVFE